MEGKYPNGGSACLWKINLGQTVLGGFGCVKLPDIFTVLTGPFSAGVRP
jgi:hypothetical protein